MVLRQHLIYKDGNYVHYRGIGEPVDAVREISARMDGAEVLLQGDSKG
jgi:hypothetical protein